ncbi:hypothetical protein [Sphingomonas sp. M1-B02]|uniref:hypothetical protein n=1 Tax=Sphingomonas sp. M1-B02 TaxID=3114300 RepID=UPI002240B1C5|nr:hypothetical protein [Sphingomonas sp. S6-11]UZK66676.1 hypothetical protein OKW87_02220 [Sphingomonas sp. S6-11]
MIRATMAAVPLVAVSLAGVPSAYAQSGLVYLPVGAILETGIGQTLKVLKSVKHPQYDWTLCDIVEWKNGGAASNVSTTDCGDLLKAVNRVRDAKGLPWLTAAQIRVGPQAAGAAAPAAAAAAPAAAGLTGPCGRTAYTGPVSGATPASAALFKRRIADLYTMQTRAPYWYGVTFEAFQVGTPIRNTVGNQPGYGAVRVNSGAPVNAVMYPVSSTYVVCEQSPGQAERRRIVNSHYCFVGAANEWICAGGGGPPQRITPLR